MVKRILHILLLTTFIVLSAGCTHNDGDIGDLFGRWKVESLRADGSDLPLYDEDVLVYCWSFQGDLVWIQTLHPHHDFMNVKGMWSRHDDILSLDFSFTGDDGDPFYRPPSSLHLVSDGVTDLNIESLTSSEMHVLYVSDLDGVRYDYYLKKYY